MLNRLIKNIKSFFIKSNSINKIEKKIDYSFQNKQILEQAFTHKSINNSPRHNYERLEFLGDRVLGLIIASKLYFQNIQSSEGDLAYAQDTNTLYVYDGSSWDRISSGSDESPRVTTEPATTHSLNSDGTTSTVTMVAEDPEGFDIEYAIKYLFDFRVSFC